MRERLVKAPGGANDRAPLDPHHAIMAAGLDHLGVERRGTEDPTDDRPVELEAIRDDQRTCGGRHARCDVANKGQGVSVAASSDDGRRPETRPHLHRREHPRWPVFPPVNERITSACSSVATKPVVLPSLNRRHTEAARSSQRATVFQAQPFGPGDRQTD